MQNQRTIICAGCGKALTEATTYWRHIDADRNDFLGKFASCGANRCNREIRRKVNEERKRLDLTDRKDNRSQRYWGFIQDRHPNDRMRAELTRTGTYRSNAWMRIPPKTRKNLEPLMAAVEQLEIARKDIFAL